MNTLSDTVTYILGLSVFLERLIEIAFTTVERSVKLGEKNPQRYALFKRIACSGIALIFGPVITLMAGQSLGFNSTSGPGLEVVVGLIAGALAPYSHAVVELVRNASSQLSANNINSNSSLPANPSK